MNAAAKNELISQVKAARRVSVPIIAVTTPDPAATIEAISEAIPDTKPKVMWDVVEGVQARNDAGKEAAARMVGEVDLTVGNPLEAFRRAKVLPDETVIFFHLANRWVVDPQVMQAVWNLRDAFKANRRTVVLLGPSIDLPPELTGDVIVFDEPLPDAEKLTSIIRERHAEAKLPVFEDGLGKAVEAVQGLPAFQVEQVVAMSLTADGLDVPALWERKRRQIELTPGLKVLRDPARYGDIGGVPVIKDFLGKILAGKSRPNAIVFIDEIEKFLAGATGQGGDTSGVSQDQLGTLLSYMQDHNAVGCIFVGPPGSAKSMVAKATGNEGGVPTIQLDPGGMKGSLVGQSEQQLRNALKVVTSVSNGKSLWIATCNAIADLPPELRRRFTLGTFFFDLPGREERAAIWGLYLPKHGIGAKQMRDWFGVGGTAPDDGWTGAEIKQACDIAWRLGCSLKEAAAFVVPVSKSAPEKLATLRKMAAGRFLSASKPGVYELPDQQPIVNNKQKAGRLVGVEE